MAVRRRRTKSGVWGRRLDANDCQLLVIDLQEKFVPFLRHKGRVLRATRLLLRTAGVLGIPVVVTEHNPERIGATVPEIASELERLPGHARLRKDIFSCLGDEAVREAVVACRRPTILVAGCETHICVLQTTLDALAAGYGVHVAADAVSSRAVLDWERGLGRITRAGAVVSTAEMTAYELLGRSDTAAFKALLPTFKEWAAADDEGR
ncbi:MAG: isochorismatase family protein [Acidobacteria bacterium]|nr:isochorismatase family protein [Acidobacteriota bacterium]